jgi:hypothetical protein
MMQLADLVSGNHTYVITFSSFYAVTTTTHGYIIALFLRPLFNVAKGQETAVPALFCLFGDSTVVLIRFYDVPSLVGL